MGRRGQWRWDWRGTLRVFLAETWLTVHRTIAYWTRSIGSARHPRTSVNFVIASAFLVNFYIMVTSFVVLTLTIILKFYFVWISAPMLDQTLISNPSICFPKCWKNNDFFFKRCEIITNFMLSRESQIQDIQRNESSNSNFISCEDQLPSSIKRWLLTGIFVFQIVVQIRKMALTKS